MIKIMCEEKENLPVFIGNNGKKYYWKDGGFYGDGPLSLCSVDDPDVCLIKIRDHYRKGWYVFDQGAYAGIREYIWDNRLADYAREYFDNRDDLIKAIEDYLSSIDMTRGNTEEDFFDWYNRAVSDPKLEWKFNKVSKIFEENGCDEDMDVEECWNKLSDARKDYLLAFIYDYER